jgi:hypothetical protein
MKEYYIARTAAIPLLSPHSLATGFRRIHRRTQSSQGSTLGFCRTESGGQLLIKSSAHLSYFSPAVRGPRFRTGNGGQASGMLLFAALANVGNPGGTAAGTPEFAARAGVIICRTHGGSRLHGCLRTLSAVPVWRAVASEVL